MKVHAYVTCFNEAQILPFTLDHYSRRCERVFLLDNESTDESREIAARYPNVEVSTWSSNDEFDEILITQLRSSRYKSSRGKCDWVVVCDADEFLHGMDALDAAHREGVSLPVVEGYQMVSSAFPVHDGRPLTELVTTGFRDVLFDKQVVFDPMLDLAFGPGAHSFQCKAARDTKPRGLKLLHYRHLGFEYMHGKDMNRASRLSARTRSLGLCSHYQQSSERAASVFETLLSVAKPVL